MEEESVIFVRTHLAPDGAACLRFIPSEILEVKSTPAEVSYLPGRDFNWIEGTNIISLTKTSRIRAWGPSDLRREKMSQDFDCSHRDGGDEIFYAAGREYHDMQVSVTSRHAKDAWRCPLPLYAGDLLSGSIGKLRRGEPLKLVVLGDSISEGANSSAAYPAPPFQPGYAELLTEKLRNTYRSSIILENLSKGGMASNWGCVTARAVADMRPDLVILAFGMNDAPLFSEEISRENILSIIDTVKQGSPQVEFILVSPMLSNPDWVSIDHSSLFRYRDMLEGVRGPGCALADITSIWRYLLEVKPFCDMTGNGVNHPNDFGYRIYAHALSSLLINPEVS